MLLYYHGVSMRITFRYCEKRKLLLGKNDFKWNFVNR